MCTGAHRDPKEGGRSLGAGVTGSFEEPDTVGINQTDPLEEQQVFLTSEPYLQPLNLQCLG